MGAGVDQGASVQELANIRGEALDAALERGSYRHISLIPEVFFLAGLLISEKWAIRINIRLRQQL